MNNLGTLTVPGARKVPAKPAERTATPASPLPASGLRLSAKERFALLEQFATLVDSGIQVAQALAGMRAQCPDPRQRAVLQALEHGIGGGLPLSAAMASLPRSFPPLLVQMVRAGETTGQLGDMLRRTVDGMELDAALRGKVRSALLYPAIMAVMTAGVVVFLLTCIVPKFETLLRGKTLPTPTRLLLAAGDLLQHHWPWLLAGLAAAITGAVLALRTTAGARWFDTLLLRLPGIGALRRTVIHARCTRTFGLLLQAGVPLPAALEHTAEVAGSQAFAAIWQRARHTVTNGGSLREAVADRPLLGSSFGQLVAAGESTATLDRVMLKLGQKLTKDLERAIRDLVTIVEPVMVLLMAAIVGFVALSIMMPIFKMSRG